MALDERRPSGNLKLMDSSDGNVNGATPSLPLFDVQHVQLQFPIAADFVAAQVANNVLVLALSTGRILRIDLDAPEDIDGTSTPIRQRQVC